MDRINSYSVILPRLYSSDDNKNISVSAKVKAPIALSEQVYSLTNEIAARTRLSTTGYQIAMRRINNPKKLDKDTFMTMRRAQQYIDTAKRTYPSSTLKSLASLQASSIYHTDDDELRGAIEMSPEQLSDCITKCRKNGFANCDIQALEVAVHLKHRLGIDDFEIVSNNKLSHNYVVIKPCNDFPKGAIVDSWTGQGVLELNIRTKLKFEHQEGNFRINENMHKWLEKYGRYYVLPG